jgi:hypothetical protein
MTTALLLAALTAAALAQSADKPALAAGDTWTYRQVTDGKETSYTRRVVAVAADGSADMLLGERPYRMDDALNVIDPKSPDARRGQYKFPMKVGEEWAYVTQVPLMNLVVDQRHRYKVAAYEPLTVPAGTFDCFRVEGTSDLNWKQSYTRQVRETYWYCPKVGSFAKMTRDVATISRDSPSSREQTEIVLVRFARKGG